MVFTKPLPPSEILRDTFSYEPETGLVRWRKRTKQSTITVGDVAGRFQCNGYIQIGFAGKFYPAHRIIWAVVYGEDPDCAIDHANCDPADNRLCNLRLAGNSDNQANARRSSRNKTGYKGVYVHKRNNRIAACICVNGRGRHLGYFDTLAEAAAAYRAAAREAFGEFARFA